MHSASDKLGENNRLYIYLYTYIKNDFRLSVKPFSLGGPTVQGVRCPVVGAGGPTVQGVCCPVVGAGGPTVQGVYCPVVGAQRATCVFLHTYWLLAVMAIHRELSPRTRWSDAFGLISDASRDPVVGCGPGRPGHCQLRTLRRPVLRISHWWHQLVASAAAGWHPRQRTVVRISHRWHQLVASAAAGWHPRPILSMFD